MKLVIGLGNPGLRYKNTRHNIGFLAVKELAKKYKINVKSKKYLGLFGIGVIEGGKTSLFMPQTYMNLSGNSVNQAKKALKIDTSNMLVICDDVNLKFGSIRLREKGSSGGHNGLKSIIEYLETNEFPRLRIGVGSADKIGDMSGFVLDVFNREEKKNLNSVIQKSAECVVSWIQHGSAKAMSLFNNS